MTTANFSMRTVTVITAVTALSWALPALAVAPLEGRTITGDRVDAYDASAVMIYDPNADLTWLRDWSVNGGKHWVDQQIWASNLQMGNFANWSLPASLNKDGSGPCEGYNCIGSQMGYMWYEVLGNTAGSFTNAGPFQNVNYEFYWSDMKYAPDPDASWGFFTIEGFQSYFADAVPLYAVAVRPGDVVAPIPEPQTYAMFALGLAVLTVLSRRRLARL